MEIRSDRLSDISAAMGGDGDRAAARFARGCRCFALERDGQVAAYGWLSMAPEWIGELGLEISPARGEAYVWNCMTLEPYRRRGLYRALLEGMVARARADRIARLWIGSVEDPAEKADADAGFRPVLHFFSTRLGPLRWLRNEASPAAPHALVGEARQRLGLTARPSLAPARARVH